MSEDDIVKVAKIMLTADSWCSNCQSGLMEQLQRAFPDHAGTIQGIWDKSEWYQDEYRTRKYAWIEAQEGPKPQVWDVVCE